MSAGGNGGFKPVFGPDGEILGPQTQNIMSDQRQGLTPREALAIGVAKAHRGVTYCHYDFRSYGRSYLGTTGRVT